MTGWNDPFLQKAVFYLAVFGAATFVGVFFFLLIGKRRASGYWVTLALLATGGLFYYLEFMQAPPPPPPPAPKPKPKPVVVVKEEPKPEPPKPKPKPKPKKVVPYKLEIVSKQVERGYPEGSWKAHGPSESRVKELIFGDAVQSAMWEFPISHGYEKFRGNWKSTLHQNLDQFVTWTRVDKNERGVEIDARVNMDGMRTTMFGLGFSTTVVRPRFQIEKNPSSHSSFDLAEALSKATVEQSNYSLGGYVLTEAGLLKAEIGGLNFLYQGVRYFVDVVGAQPISSDADGEDVLYTVNLTPGAAD